MLMLPGLFVLLPANFSPALYINRGLGLTKLYVYMAKKEEPVDLLTKSDEVLSEKLESAEAWLEKIRSCWQASVLCLRLLLADTLRLLIIKATWKKKPSGRCFRPSFILKPTA